MKYMGILVLTVLLISCTATTQTAGNDAVKTPDLPKQCKQTIDYTILVAALPTSVAGFATKEAPDGSTLSWTDPTNANNQVKYSSATAHLEKDTGTTDNPQTSTIEISALDTCYVQFLSAAWLGFYEYSGTQGYLKKTTLAGYPAWEQYDKSSSSYSYDVLVKDRVFVSVQGGEGVAQGDVQTAANAVDYAKIAGAAST